MGFFKFKNISLDSYEANNLVKTSFGTKSDEHIEDNIIINMNLLDVIKKLYKDKSMEHS